MKKKSLKMLTLIPAMALLIGGGFALANTSSETYEPEVVKAEETTTDNNVAIEGEHIYVILRGENWASTNASEAADIYLRAWYADDTTTTLDTESYGIRITTNFVGAGSDVGFVHVLTADEAETIANFNHVTLTRRSHADPSIVWNSWTWYGDGSTDATTATSENPSVVADAHTLTDNAGLNLFATYENASSWNDCESSWNKERTIYFQQDTNSWGAHYVHMYSSSNSYAPIAWPGTSISLNGTSATSFKYYSETPASGTIFKVKVLSWFDTVIFNNGNSGHGNETSAYTVVDGAYYTLSGTTESTTLGLAAKFVYDTDKAISSVVASSETGILEGSICGLSSAEATTLYAEYTAAIADTTAATAVNRSTYYTYLASDTSQNDDYTYQEIAAQLAVLAGSSSTSAQYALVAESSTSYIAIGVISAIAVLSIGGFTFYRKKRASI